MSKKQWSAISGLVMFLALAAQAQVDVTKQRGDKQGFAVTGFAGNPSVSAQVAEVLKNDLTLSGYFKIVPSQQAEFVQQGSVRIEGSNTGIIECTVTLQATGKVVLSKTYTGSPQDFRRMVHKLTDDIVKEVTGEPGIAQSKIAFVLTRNGVKELAVMDYDGYNVRQLTHDHSLSVRPRWSADGRKIAYTSYLNKFPDVIEVDLYTGARKRIAGYPGLNSGATYSPDGRSIALTLSKDGNPELYVTDASGGGLQRLTHTRGAESSPTWSGDGKYIAFVSDDRGSPQIYMIPRGGGEPTRLTVSPSYNTEPCWSHPPAGSAMRAKLAMTSRVGGKFEIGVYDLVSKEVQAVVADGTDNQDPSWAPDGRHLVFSKARNWRSQLYLLDEQTKEQIELPSVEGDASEPAWGP